MIVVLSNPIVIGPALGATLLLTLIAEAAAPAFAAARGGLVRLRTNIALALLCGATDALVPLLGAVLARTAVPASFGLFAWTGLPPPVRFAGSLVAISLGTYALHRLSHRIDWLWRLHRVHHSDVALDVTTAFRHHPLDRLVSLAWYGSLTVLLGLSPAAVALYGALQLLLAIPQHADLSLGRAEAWLHGVVVTPGVHHVHHSARRSETDSNYGEVVTLWDRLFGTFRASDAEERRVMEIGLGGAEDDGANSVRHQLGSVGRR